MNSYFVKAPSELWRLEFAARACISTALVTFLALNPVTRLALTHNGVHPNGPTFAAFTAIATHDVTLGATLLYDFNLILMTLLITNF